MKNSYTLLIALGLMLCIAFFSPCLAELPVFQAAQPLMAGEQEVPGVDNGYTEPCAADWDGDGDLDFLVGLFLDAPVHLFINEAEEGEPPALVPQGAMLADGEVINGPFG